VPLLSQVDLDPREIKTITPLLVTNARFTFMRTEVSKNGYARFGFTECPVDREEGLLLEFHRVLVAESSRNGWGCSVPSFQEGLVRMKTVGATPKFVVMSKEEPLPVPDGLIPLTCGFPPGVALISVRPEDAGLYTRVGDYVGVMAKRVNLAFVAVIPA
jgi:hypothetical protein